MLKNKTCCFNYNQDNIEVSDEFVYVNKLLVPKIGSGIDGEIYKYQDKAIKLYNDQITVKMHLTKQEIERLSKINTKHIILPKELLLDTNNKVAGYVMNYVDLNTKQNILLANKINLIKQLKELEQELILLGKKHFLLDDNNPENLFYNYNLYLFDSDSFMYEKYEEVSKQNIEIFAWCFIRYIVYSFNENLSEFNHLRYASRIYDIYRSGNYYSISNFIEDIININLDELIYIDGYNKVKVKKIIK